MLFVQRIKLCDIFSVFFQILDCIIDVFNSGGDMHLDVPRPASSCPEPPKIVRSVLVKRLGAVHCSVEE